MQLTHKDQLGLNYDYQCTTNVRKDAFQSILTKNVLNRMKDIINTHSQFLTNYYSKTSTKIVVLDILWKIGNHFERHKAYYNTKYFICLYPYSTNIISNECKAYDIFHCYYKMRVILFLLKTIYAYVRFSAKIFTSIARLKTSWSC